MNYEDYKSIVNKWEIEPEKKEDKIATLEKWNEKLSDDEKKIVFKICENIHYYSFSKVAEKIEEVQKKVISVTDNKIKNVLFLPLKTKSRVESSENIFIPYINFSGLREITPQNLIIKKSRDFIEEFVDAKNYTKKLITEYIEKTKEYELCSDELAKVGDDIAQKKLMENKIRACLRRTTKINNDLQDFWSNKTYGNDVQKIIFIDDFLCSASNLYNFLESILPILDKLNLDDELCIDFWFLEKYRPSMGKINNIIGKFKNNVSLNIFSSVDSINFVEQSAELGIKKEVMIKTIDDISKNYKIPKNQSEYNQNLGIATYTNAPNNNLNFIINESKEWEPLFRRTKMIKIDNKKKIKEFLLELRERSIPN